MQSEENPQMVLPGKRNMTEDGDGVELETAAEVTDNEFGIGLKAYITDKSITNKGDELVRRSDAEQYAEDMAEKACKIAVRDTLKQVIETVDESIEEAENTIGEIRKCEADSCPHNMDELEHKEDEIIAVAKKLSLEELRGELENKVE